MSKKHYKDQPVSESRESSVFESGMFWLFAFITFIVLLDMLFFPKVSDFWELLLIALWRLSVEKNKHSQKILLTSVCTITILIPFFLAVRQDNPAKEFAIWLFYILISEIGLQVWKIVKQEWKLGLK